MLCRLGLLAGWILCHLSFYASLMMVYLLAGSVAWSCLGLVVGVPSFVVLAVLILVLGRLPLVWWCVVTALIASAY